VSRHQQTAVSHTHQTSFMESVLLTKEESTTSPHIARVAGMCREIRRQTGSGTIVLLIKRKLPLHVIENIKK
jgi:hypothetical protein